MSIAEGSLPRRLRRVLSLDDFETAATIPSASADLWLRRWRRGDQHLAARQPCCVWRMGISAARPHRRLAPLAAGHLVWPDLCRPVWAGTHGYQCPRRLSRRSGAGPGGSPGEPSDGDEWLVADPTRGGGARSTGRLVPGLSAGRAAAHCGPGRARGAGGVWHADADRGYRRAGQSREQRPQRLLHPAAAELYASPGTASLTRAGRSPPSRGPCGAMACHISRTPTQSAAPRS